MKKVIMSLGLVACVTIASAAITKVETTERTAIEVVVTDQKDANKKKITLAETPAPVQRAFSANKVDAASITDVWAITEGDATTYKIKATVDGKETFYKYSADGNVMEHKAK
jgi:uncharacterized OsmC-like protein